MKDTTIRNLIKHFEGIIETLKSEVMTDRERQKEWWKKEDKMLGLSKFKSGDKVKSEHGGFKRETQKSFNLGEIIHVSWNADNGYEYTVETPDNTSVTGKYIGYYKEYNLEAVK